MTVDKLHASPQGYQVGRRSEADPRRDPRPAGGDGSRPAPTGNPGASEERGPAARSPDIIPAVAAHDLSALPGGDLVLKGLEDLAHGTPSAEALLVLIGAPKLRSLGIAVPVHHDAASPEHRLYAWLSAENGATAHGRYNALVRRLVSFERALACVSA